MISRSQQLRMAATFIAQARILCDGVQGLLGDDAEHVARLNEIGVALGEECAHLEGLIAGIRRAHGDETDREEAALASDATHSRIEQLNEELLDCERLNHQLDELTNTLDFTASEAKTSEDVILKSNADYAEKQLLDKMETLASCLALERPVTPRETLIFALRALAPLQELLMAVSEEHSYERKQGCIAYRLLQGIVTALEEIAGVARAELGFEGPQTEAEIIKKLEAALAQKASS